jgi:hypothetical protein
LSQVSRGHLCFLDPSFNHGINLVEAPAQFRIVQNLDGNDLRQAKPQDSVVSAGEEKARYANLVWLPHNGEFL